MMRCPGCGSGDLEQASYREIPVARCPKCQGMWVTSAALSSLIQGYLDDHPDLPHLPLELARVRPHAFRHARRCPACGAAMSAYNYAYNSNIYLDRCAPCGHVWLDQNELVALAQHVRGHPKLNRMGESLGQAMVKFEKDRTQLESLSLLPFLLCAHPVPIGDDATGTRFPYVNIAIISLCLLIPLIARSQDVAMGAIWSAWGLVPSDWPGRHALQTLVSHMFLHGGVVHLAGNLLALAIFGDNVESRLGHLGYSAFFLVCGAAGGLAHIAYELTSAVPVIGASGAISGVLGAYVLFFPTASIRTIHGYSAPAFAYVGVWIALQCVAIVAMTRYDYPVSIAYFAHLGGLVAGLAIGGIVLAWQSWHEQRRPAS